MSREQKYNIKYKTRREREKEEKKRRKNRKRVKYSQSSISRIMKYPPSFRADLEISRHFVAQFYNHEILVRATGLFSHSSNFRLSRFQSSRFLPYWRKDTRFPKTLVDLHWKRLTSPHVPRGILADKFSRDLQICHSVI